MRTKFDHQISHIFTDYQLNINLHYCLMGFWGFGVCIGDDPVVLVQRILK